MAGWLLLIFFICLHNQLSSVHFVIKYAVKMDGCSFQQFTATFGLVFVLTLENALS